MLVFRVKFIIPIQWQWVGLFVVIGLFGFGTQVNTNNHFGVGMFGSNHMLGDLSLGLTKRDSFKGDVGNVCTGEQHTFD